MKPILPFLMAGTPTLAALPGMLADASALGIDAVEIGLPHSDPIADGPTLQACAQKALAEGVTPGAVLEMLARCRQASPPVVLFSYLNPLLQIGASRLSASLRKTPVRSVLVVDLPYGEEAEFEGQLRAAGYPLVPMIAPTTDLARAEQLLRGRPDPGTAAPFAQRFAYVVARLGVTGSAGEPDWAALQARIEDLQRITDRPLAVGFGLGDAASLDRIRSLGVVPVVGSALAGALAAGRSLRTVLASQ